MDFTLIKNCTKKQNTIHQNWLQQKTSIIDDELSEYIGTLKELWETLKSLGVTKKKLISNFNAVESKIH